MTPPPKSELHEDAAVFSFLEDDAKYIRAALIKTHNLREHQKQNTLILNTGGKHIYI